MRCTLFALGALASVAPVLAEPSAVATPASPWEASTEDGVCRMQRAFEAGGKPHLLILEQNAPDRAFGIALAGPSLALLSPDTPLRLSFATGHYGIENKARIGPNRQFGHVAVLQGVSLAQDETGDHNRIDTSAAQQVERIAISQGEIEVSFATGSLAEAATVINDCTAQILRNWGLDPDVQYGLRQGVSADKIKFTYPSIAARYLRGGPVDVVALVNAAGAATECRIITSSGDKDIDAAACEGMTKARYRPALDAAGQPVASFWKTRINYAATSLDAKRAGK